MAAAMQFPPLQRAYRQAPPSALLCRPASHQLEHLGLAAMAGIQVKSFICMFSLGISTSSKGQRGYKLAMLMFWRKC